MKKKKYRIHPDFWEYVQPACSKHVIRKRPDGSYSVLKPVFTDAGAEEFLKEKGAFLASTSDMAWVEIEPDETVE